MIEALEMLKSIKTEPYPGLRPFQANESHLFFGRDEQVEKLLEKIQNSHFVAVVGPSGCGKSSLVKAGLIPDLKTGFLMDEGRKCRTIEMRPGDKPFDNLARALYKSFGETTPIGCIKAELKRGPKGLIESICSEVTPNKEVILLVVDQFEELFRFKQNNNMDEVIAFIALLIESANHSGELAIHIVITMRSDFLGECSLFPGLPEILNDNQFLTPRLTRERMKEAIEAPARVCGGMLDPYLVNTLLNDVGVDHDQLPLLQHALMRMWALAKESCGKKEPIVDIPIDKFKENQPRIILTMKHYAEIGKLQKALTQHANQAYDQLNEKQQRIAQVIFRRLSERNAEQKDVRRAATVQDIANVAEVDNSEVIAVADIFIDPAYNFLTASDEQLTAMSLLDISHESIIRQWDKMRDWIMKEFISAMRYKRLIADSYDHKAGSKQLLSGIALENALDWKSKNGINKQWALRYSDEAEFEQVMNYINESRNEEEDGIRKELKKKKTRKAWKYSTVTAFMVLVIAIALISFRSSLAIEEAKAVKLKAQSENLEKSIILERYYSKTKQDSLNNEVEKVRVDTERKKLAAMEEKNNELAKKERELVKLTTHLKERNQELIEKTNELIVKSITSTIWDLPFYSKLDAEDKALAIKELLPQYMKDSTDKQLALYNSDLQALAELRENFLYSHVPETYKKLQTIWTKHQTPLVNSLIVKTINENLIYKQRLSPSGSGFIDIPILAVSDDRNHFALGSDYYKYFGRYDDDSLLIDARFGNSLTSHIPAEDSTAHEHYLSSITYDNRKLITVEGNGNVVEFTPAGINYITRIPTYEHQLYKISPKGEYVITAPSLNKNDTFYSQASKDRMIRIWKIPSSKKEQNFLYDSIKSDQWGLKNILFSPQGDKAIFLYNNDEGKIYVRNIPEKDSLFETSRIEAANFSNDGEKLITISKTGTVKFTETNGTTNDFKEIQQLPGFDYLHDYTDVKLSGDQKKLIVKSNQQYLLYERSNGGNIFKQRKDGSELTYKEFPWNQEPDNIDFLNDNSIISVSKAGDIFLWKLYPKFETANEAFSAIKTAPYFSTALLPNDSSSLESWFAQANQNELDSIAGELLLSVRYKDNPDIYLQNLDLSKRIYRRLSEITEGETKKDYEEQVVSLNYELNEFDISLMKLNYDLAIKLVPRFKEIISIKEKRYPMESFEVKELSDDYWNLSWYQLFAEDFEGTIQSVKRGMNLHPDNDGMITNLALAYLLNNNYNEAEALYKKYKGKKYSNQERNFTTSFLQDLDDMILAGVIKPTDEKMNEQVKKIREILK